MIGEGSALSRSLTLTFSPLLIKMILYTSLVMKIEYAIHDLFTLLLAYQSTQPEGNMRESLRCLWEEEMIVN